MVPKDEDIIFTDFPEDDAGVKMRASDMTEILARQTPSVPRPMAS